MTKLLFEKHQVWLYLFAILLGLVTGGAVPETADQFELLLWPVLGLLLYATFTQVPLIQLPAAFRDMRFVAAVLAGNFLVIPLLAWGLVQWLPDNPALRLGMLLVLLVPCTDWFIAFTQLGKGDTRRAIAITPLNLLLQFLLLPLYLWLFMGESFHLTLAPHIGHLGLAFTGLILLPLLFAYVTEWYVQQQPGRSTWIERLGVLPVPLLTIVVFLIAASQVGTVLDSLPVLSHVFLIFVVYLIAAGILARIISTMFVLDTAAGRTLAFSMGTRNSFVVLPLALALPAGWETVVVVIVFQSLVELFGMSIYLWWVPRMLFPGNPN